jgi:hypothetical protein
MRDSNLQTLGKEDDSEKCVVLIQPSINDVAGIGLTEEETGEPEWIKRFFRASQQEGPPRNIGYLENDGYFQSDDEEEADSEDDDETSLGNEDNKLSPLPFQGVEFCYRGQDYDEIIQPQRNRKRTPKIFLNKDAFIDGRKRELDCGHRQNWTGHCHDASCREKDILIHRIRVV